MPSLDDAYNVVYITVLIILSILILCCFIRVIKGPVIADRIVGVNMIGTLVIISICVLARKLNEDYLIDVSLIYALISFLAVVVLTKIFMGEKLRQQKKKEEKLNKDDTAESGEENDR